MVTPRTFWPLQGGRGITAAEITLRKQWTEKYGELQGGRGITAAEIKHMR